VVCFERAHSSYPNGRQAGYSSVSAQQDAILASAGDPLLDISPWWMTMALGTISAVPNDWMHMNVMAIEWVGMDFRYAITTV
jgi:hypothetical protein